MLSVERSIVVIGVFGGEKCVRLGGAVMWDFRVQILYRENILCNQHHQSSGTRSFVIWVV